MEDPVEKQGKILNIAESYRTAFEIKIICINFFTLSPNNCCLYFVICQQESELIFWQTDRCISVNSDLLICNVWISWTPSLKGDINYVCSQTKLQIDYTSYPKTNFRILNFADFYLSSIPLDKSWFYSTLTEVLKRSRPWLTPILVPIWRPLSYPMQNWKLLPTPTFVFQPKSSTKYCQ